MNIELSKSYEQFLKQILESVSIVNPKVAEGLTPEILARAGVFMLILANSGPLGLNSALSLFATAVTVQMLLDKPSQMTAKEEAELTEMFERIEASLNVSNEGLRFQKILKELEDPKDPEKGSHGQDKWPWN